jgi:hypothetical protein
MEEISMKGYTFELFDKKVSLFLNSKYENIFSFFFKKLNNLEDWDLLYDDLLRELIILEMGIIDPIQIEKIIKMEKSVSRFFSGALFDMPKIKEFYLVEKRNKIIENILKN